MTSGGKMLKAMRWMAAAAMLWCGAAFGYSGNCIILAIKAGPNAAKPFPGNQVGYNDAKTWAGTNGTIQVYPGCDGQINYGTLTDSVSVYRLEAGSWVLMGARMTTTTPRLGPASSAGSGGAIRIVDGVTFAQTGAGIQAALDDVPTGGATVLLPAGTITVPTTLSMKSQTALVGSEFGTRLLYTGTGSAITNAATSAQGCVVRNMEIDGLGNANPNVHGVYFNGMSFGTVEHCYIHNMTGDGVRLYAGPSAGGYNNAYFNHFEDVTVRGGKAGLRLIGGGAANEVCNENIALNFFSDTVKNGFILDAGIGNELISCDAQTVDSTGFGINGPNTVLISPTAESVAAAGTAFLVGGAGDYSTIVAPNIVALSGAAFSINASAAGVAIHNWNGKSFIGRTGTLTYAGFAGAVSYNGDLYAEHGNGYYFRKASDSSADVGITSTTDELTLATGGLFRWNVATGGDLAPNSDNSYSIGTTSKQVKDYFGMRGQFADSLRANKGLYLGGQFIPKILRNSATLDFDLTALTVQDLTITVTGAVSGDDVVLGVPAGSVTTRVQYTAWVSAANTVTVRAGTLAVGENPASGTFSVTVIQR